MSKSAFRAAGFPWRLYCGRQVIEQDLQQAVDRAGANRAFVVCSPSVNRRTDTVRRIAAVLGHRYAGVFDGIEKDFNLRLGLRRQAGGEQGRGRYADRSRRRQCHCRDARGGDLHGGTRRPVPDHDPVSGREARLQPSAPRAEAANHQYSDYANQRHEPRRHGLEESGSRPPDGVFRSQDASPFHLPR